MPNSPSIHDKFLVGVDVGTGSARAAVFDAQGRIYGSSAGSIEMWRPAPDFVEQSSDNIWDECCQAVRTALNHAEVDPGLVEGIGFDATCSLVALGENYAPVSISPTGRDQQNVIVWMDHRAIDQANRINRSGHEVLNYVGGTISPEMETPKLLWLKEKLPQNWERAKHFFDLPDFLTYRATGDPGRSLCSLVCKWTYLGHKRKGSDTSGWSDSYFREIGLPEVVEEGYRKIGTRVRELGEPVGKGLSQRAAQELGLRTGTAVSASIIDAHAGGLGVLGAVHQGEALDAELLNSRLAIIAGTSSCHMGVSAEPRFIPGCWGPYYSAMIPEFWLTEGGQSAVGALIDHVIFNHAAFPAATKEADSDRLNIFDFLNRRLTELREERGLSDRAMLTSQLHVYPDFHGNRSPRANPALRGMISGLRLDAGIDELALLYLATIQAIAAQTRHIVEEMNAKGYAIRSLFVCGGGLKNEVFLQEHADITQCDLVLPREPEAVLLGSAVLAAVAAGIFPSVLDAMKGMTEIGRVVKPDHGPVQGYHDRKYRVYRRMYEDQIAYCELMGPV
jgi:FGGY-family pentulose kinase